jgi:hypothetical protein
MAGVSEQSIRQWARSGLLPHEQTPLGMLFAVGDLDAAITAREHQRREKVRSRQLDRRASD